MSEIAGKFDPGMIARDWWNVLDGGDERKRDRGAFAELRRSADPLDLAFARGFNRLHIDLKVGNQDWPLLRAAAIANVLAHVREDDSRAVARALGPQADNAGEVMSEGRFRRLLQSEEGEDLTRNLVRAVKMLKGKANVADLARAIWWWNDRVRRDWAFRYLNAEPPAVPAAATHAESATP
jgi:CRISPR system Cascade subunit CasB